jgi:hypothetical protein
METATRTIIAEAMIMRCVRTVRVKARSLVVARRTPLLRGTAAEMTGVMSGALRTAVTALPLAFFSSLDCSFAADSFGSSSGFPFPSRSFEFSDFESILIEKYKVPKLEIGKSLAQFHKCPYIEYSERTIVDVGIHDFDRRTLGRVGGYQHQCPAPQGSDRCQGSEHAE